MRLRLVADEAEILTICTVPDRRRDGVGRYLLDAAAQAMKTAGAQRLLLEVAIDNRAAIRLYRAFRFVELGRRRGYYQGPQGAVDALILGRDI